MVIKSHLFFFLVYSRTIERVTLHADSLIKFQWAASVLNAKNVFNKNFLIEVVTTSQMRTRELPCFFGMLRVKLYHCFRDDFEYISLTATVPYNLLSKTSN